MHEKPLNFFDVTEAYESKEKSLEPIGNPDARKTIGKS